MSHILKTPMERADPAYYKTLALLGVEVLEEMLDEGTLKAFGERRAFTTSFRSLTRRMFGFGKLDPSVHIAHFRLGRQLFAAMQGREGTRAEIKRMARRLHAFAPQLGSGRAMGTSDREVVQELLKFCQCLARLPSTSRSSGCSGSVFISLH